MIENMEAHFAVHGDYIDNTMYPVNLYYSDQRGDFRIQEVAFRTKSSTSRNLPRTIDWRGREVYHQTAFQLQFNATFDYEERSNKYEVLRTREVFDLEQLNFEYTSFHEASYDQAMISHAYAHDLFTQAGVTVAKASYGLVYLKIGEQLIDYGFFTLIEPIDSEFLKRHFDSNLAMEYGDLYKVTDIQDKGMLDLDYEGLVGIDDDDTRYTYSLRNNRLDGSRRTHEDFISFVESINNQTIFDARYDQLLDIDALIRYLAMAFLIGHTDDLRYNHNNYYLYFDVYSRQVTLIPFDFDNVLGFGKHIDASGEFGVDFDTNYNLDNASPLIQHLFANDDLVGLYEQYLLDFIDTIFIYEAFETRYLAAKALYEPILLYEDHLGQKRFDLRQVEDYYQQKTSHIQTQLNP